ncbi:hypothetical protein EJB05_03094, partial [Eragrostis curvula]
MELDADRRRRRGGKDHISELPDDLLHNILVHLSSTAAAARTSLLSHRWRYVWAYMPEIVFHRDSTTPALSLDSIDAALQACSAPTIRRLEIRLCQDKLDVHHVAQWLRFASQRLVGSLDLSLILQLLDSVKNKELMLPVCERATEISVSTWSSLVLRPPATGSFKALIHLKICYIRMDGRELGRLVSLQCPCLRKLSVIGPLVAACEVSISSESLKSIKYHCSYTRKLELTTPRLTKISASLAKEAYVVAPKLEKISWDDTYDPSRHQFVVTGRHLRRLSTSASRSPLLIRRFDTIDELRLYVSIPPGTEGYISFQKDMCTLPTCQTLWLTVRSRHRLTPSIFYILERTSHIRKLKLNLDPTPPLK